MAFPQINHGQGKRNLENRKACAEAEHKGSTEEIIDP